MTDQNRPLIIYHGGCRDGFCAAWVINRHFKAKGIEPSFFPGVYGNNPPDCTGRDVIIVDFSYPLDLMKVIADEAKTLLVLDHHKSAAEALGEFAKNAPANTEVIFNMEMSGAGLAWEYFFGPDERPWLVDYIEDRDLWRFKLLHSKEINAYISILPFDFYEWDEAAYYPLKKVEDIGYAIEGKVAQYVAEVRKNAIWIEFEGRHVPCVNAPQVDISELVGAMAEGHPYRGEVIVPQFSMGWFQRADGMFQYSLRSRGDFDVSVIAKKYGGGGHKNAAGFQLDEPVHLKCARGTVE